MQILFHIIDLSTFIIPVLALIGFFIGIYFYKRIGVDYKILTFLFLYSFTNEVLSHISAKYFGSNLFFLSTYSLAELFFLYAFLRLQKKKTKKYIDCVFVLICVFNIFEILSVNFLNFNIFQTYSRSINSIFLLIFGFSLVISKLNNEELENYNRLIIVIPCFVTVNAIIYLPINLLINYKDISVYVIWFINVINLIIFFCFIINQIWKLGKTQKV